ncbi:cyclic 2,3-diphosphoglycerate synthase [Candidatus Micrarchaeota archaeon]|nr:cyclic 2,3-diphosphoglycerate synthase [Candidatus Micrarchaeota archaeon]MBU1166468.1 cyclic 2,3-diphosphoglycerate synthase [Candidatus Micrarchaeota archaeon]MBU1886174.1 cyclic 2,3-diphosphoglycerate synthase [Candidatus Micrarchaeota archaeon]
MMKRKALILGAAGRDFHNFNMFFKNNKNYEVVGFTATQIPNITNRKYPVELAGELYPNGIPIYDENDLEKLIKEHNVDEVYFSYSDVSHRYVMNMASRAQACGASFVLLGPKETMLKSKKKIIVVTAVRTGCGKSPLTRKLADILKNKKIKFVVIRHPMPYGDLLKQKVQRFAQLSDLDKHECTIEEREEYEPHIKNGVVVYAGVDYGEILKQAEHEADLIIWDGGNNDMSFIMPDLQFVVVDALRPGHEMWYYPGETNFRAADVIVINKAGENPSDIPRIKTNIGHANPNAEVIETDMELYPDKKIDIKGKKVIVVEDGPTVTHGGMKFGAGYEYAKKNGADIIDPRISATGSLKEVYRKYDHLESVLPAMGYYGKQLEDLTESINKSGAEVVVSGTPVDITKVLKVDIPVLHINYMIKERTGHIDAIVDKFLKK